MRRTIVACVIVALVAGASSAAAAKLITGADIKNGSITGKDLEHPTIGRKAIKKEAVIKKKLSAKVQDMLEEKGAPGPQGPVGPKGDPGPSSLTKVSNLNGPFTTLGTAVALTPDGVAFGPYADGGNSAGSVVYSGLNGRPLSSVRNLVYYARYVSDTATLGVGAPYLRIFLGNNAHDAIFSPNTQSPNPDVIQGPFHEWVTTSGSWRYDDDGGNNADISYSQLLAAHGNETISGIRVSTGNSQGVNLAALLRWIQINGQTFAFGS